MNQAPASTWVLLRGLTREAAHWGEGPNALPDLLRQALPGAAIHRPDLPGNGRLHGLRSPSTVQGMVAACRAEMARQGIRPPFHLLAMSLGAMVAAEWAHQAPHEVAGCVLINTSVRPFSPVYHRLRPRNWPTLLRHGLWPATPREREATVLRLTSNLAQQRSEVLDRWVAVRREHPVRAINALRQLLAAARYRAPRLAPPVALLLLASTHDRLVDSRCSLAMAQAWHCPLQWHPTAGHDLPLDDPAWVVRQVQDWLGSHPRTVGESETQVSNF